MTERRPAPFAATAAFADGEALARALRAAGRDGREWLALAEPGERLADEALDLARPAMGLFDAVFGAVRVAGAPWRPSRLAFDEPWRLPHALLHWWVGPPRFIRAATLRRLLRNAPAGENPVDRLFRLWDDARCIKLAAPLAHLDAEPAGLGAAGRAAVIARLATHPVFVPVPHGERIYRLPYTGLNAGIEREQTRGLFFEAAELEHLKGRVGSHARIVDVGANTGNHTLFFAGPMKARLVRPFEPLPDAAEALRRTIEANDLVNVDPAGLGQGIAAAPGRMSVERSDRGGLGATRLRPDPQGSIEVRPLDLALTEPPDFLKIDVEGMELDVLQGARATIENAKPLIFIEIANANTGRFLSWLELADYRIERIFSDKGHANYLIAPGR